MHRNTTHAHKNAGRQRRLSRVIAVVENLHEIVNELKIDEPKNVNRLENINNVSAPGERPEMAPGPSHISTRERPEIALAPSHPTSRCNCRVTA